MGKEWDRALPPVEAFEQMIRVLKPGALAFVMSSPRQDVLWRMLALLEGVGFELRQSALFWIFRTGFPKAYDVSKGIDRRQGGLIDRDSLGAFIMEHRENVGLSRQDASELVTGNRTGAFWNWENNYCVPLPKLWPKIKEVIKAPDSEWDEKLSSSDREVIGNNPNAERNVENLYGYSMDGAEITLSSTDLAKRWEGWKSQTGLKPAAECILMVNKPRSEPTIVDNVLRWGTGAINVDATRIPFQSEADKGDPDRYVGLEERQSYNAATDREKYLVGQTTDQSKGRFPANLLISDGALDTGKTTKSGKLEPHHHRSEERSIYGEFKGKSWEGIHYGGDEGSPYRFFDLDAWAEHHGFLDVAKPSRAERDFGLAHFPLKKQRKQDGSWGSHEIFEVEGSGRKTGTLNRNAHPTVKPVKLMAYLIELGCPPKGIVVDPFLGSGTTCIAAKKLRRQWIGIEINPEYAEIAEARINIRGPLDQFMEAEE